MRGVTLVELIVVIAITGLLMGLMSVSFRAGRQSIAERNSLQSIAQAIRSAQNKALAGGCTTSSCSFGVHFDTASTTLNIFEDGVVTLDGQYDSGEEVETVNLENNVAIVILSSSYSCGVSLCADVLFDPPDPVVSFTPAASSLTISITGGRSVTVGGAGSIDIN